MYIKLQNKIVHKLNLSFHAENRELTGAVDLLSYYGLREQYDKFCQKPLPASIGESHYLKDVVGDIEIRKGDDMELGQLLGPENENFNVHLRQFDVDILQQAFSLKESGPTSLPEVRYIFNDVDKLFCCWESSTFTSSSLFTLFCITLDFYK